MGKKKTQEQYIEELLVKNFNIRVIGKYIDAKTPIEHYCMKHDVFWYIAPTNALKGNGCIECGKEKISNKNKKTHQQYTTEVKKINQNIEVVGEYIGANNPILHRCKIDGYEWMVRPASVLSGEGCPKCAGNLNLTNEEYIKKLKQVNPNIKSIEEYISAKTPILHMCLIDGHTWYTQPSNTLQGYGCPKCAGNIKKTHAEYVQELAFLNSDIEVIGQYIDARTEILHRCKIDGCEWFAFPTNVLRGSGCPQCQESKGERQVRQWLEGCNIAYTYQKTFTDCKDKEELPFDFYIPEYNLCIEYDGRQHFEPVDFAGKGDKWALQQFSIIQKHDEIKNQYCQNNNICLLRIPYFKDVQEELENFLFI